MSHEVDVDRTLRVFQAFSVDGGGKACTEPYLPSCFLALAAREMGYFPTHAKLEAFQKQVDDCHFGRIIFSSFLQLCEELVDTRSVHPEVIREHMRVLDSGSGTLTTAELRLLLTASSPTISCGEVEAIVDLLDPDATGVFPLDVLEEVLMDHQRPQVEMTRRSVSPRGSWGRRSKFQRVRQNLTPDTEVDDAAAGGVGNGVGPQSHHSRAWLASATEREADLDRTFRRTDHTERMSSGREPQGATATCSDSGAQLHQPASATAAHVAASTALRPPSLPPGSPTGAHAKGHSTRMGSRRIRHQSPDISIVLDPTPFSSVMARKDADSHTHAVTPADPPAPGAQRSPRCSTLADASREQELGEPPHEPAVAGASVRGEGEGGQPVPAREVKPTAPGRKPKNPIDRCCLVC